MGTALQDTQSTASQSLHNQTGTSAQTTTLLQQQDNDNLMNSIQSQNTMFTQAIHQMDTLVERQAAFENNTQMALETIMN